MKIAIFLIILLMLLGFDFYFFSPKAEYIRKKIWQELDKDVLYLEDGSVVYGWIWGQTQDYLGGQAEDGSFFNIDSSDCREVRMNYLFDYWEKLI
jgi:hypothetical protein